MLSLSLKNEIDNLAYPPVFVPSPPTLANFLQVFSENSMGLYFWNSIVVSGLATLVALAVGIAQLRQGLTCGGPQQMREPELGDHQAQIRRRQQITRVDAQVKQFEALIKIIKCGGSLPQQRQHIRTGNPLHTLGAVQLKAFPKGFFHGTGEETNTPRSGLQDFVRGMWAVGHAPFGIMANDRRAAQSFEHADLDFLRA